MTDAVDTSKEAVERLASTYDLRHPLVGSVQVFADTSVATACTLRSLLSERDQLRREVQEARDKALDEAKAEILKRSAGNEEGYVEWFDDRPYVCEESAYRRIEALKARP